ncbi:MAG: cytochrome c biogenesis protein CcsA [Chloroflexota bacterium]
MKRNSYSWDAVLMAASFFLLAGALYLVFMWVPTSATSLEGIAQRIFYFHVPLWWVAFLAYAVTFISSLVYLARRGASWDNLACSAAEIGTVFVTLGLITGIIWAKPAWSVWWTWDPRLTTALVLWFIYIGYFLVRAYAPAAQARNFAAVISIIGTVDSFIVFMAIRWWRTQHPSPVVGTGGGLAPEMLFTFMVSLAAFTLLFVLLMRLRTTLRATQEQVTALRQAEE